MVVDSAVTLYVMIARLAKMAANTMLYITKMGVFAGSVSHTLSSLFLV